jgi:hypothetical protein
MVKSFSVLASGLLAGVLVFSALASAQDEAAPRRENPYIGITIDGWTPKQTPPEVSKAESSAPAPRHDISGIWDPRNAGLQVLGAGAMPEDGKPEHNLPYTPEGLAALKLTKPSNGVRTVLPGDTNDPVVACDPQGMPREDLYEMRTTQILQTPERVIVLYEFGKVWRSIWTDGRDFPKEAAPRWYGYSIGKWEDDNTFVVQTRGTDARTWVDRSGRPHSADLLVEERFHRIDYGTLELTVIINDPKMYTKPWIALDKLRFKLQSPHFDVTEMLCSPSELKEYNDFVGNPASNDDKGKQ